MQVSLDPLPIVTHAGSKETRRANRSRDCTNAMHEFMMSSDTISFPESSLPLSSGGAANKELWWEAIRHERILGLPALLRKSGGSLVGRSTAVQG